MFEAPRTFDVAMNSFSPSPLGAGEGTIHGYPQRHAPTPKGGVDGFDEQAFEKNTPHFAAVSGCVFGC